MPPIFSKASDRPVVFTKRSNSQFRISPCEVNCPAGNPIQKIHELIGKNLFSDALLYLRATNPFTGVTGRICTHPCQLECNRNSMDESLAIRNLERAAFDYADKTIIPRLINNQDTGKKVAVIGSGPAGLTSAYFLRLLGHHVTVFEAGPMLGGIPRSGVADLRLPKEIVDTDIEWILNTGIETRTNIRMGVDISFEKIRIDHDAVIVATGTTKEKSLNIPGAEDAIKALEYLHGVNHGLFQDMKGKVVIIGGGGVALDCAFTARRLGAASIDIICLENSDSMVAPSDDLVQAREQQITINNACTISEVKTENHRVIGVNVVSVKEFVFDDFGRVHMQFDTENSTELSADLVIFAVGLEPDLTFLDYLQPDLTPHGTLKVDGDHQTSISGVFAAGDIVDGPSIIAQAVGSGRQTAFGVHQFLTGSQHTTYILNEEGRIEPDDSLTGTELPHVVAFDEILGTYHYETKPSVWSTSQPEISYAEKISGFDKDNAQAESQRCMHCGSCKACGICVEDCPGYVLEMGPENRPEVKFGDECWHCANCRTSCPCGAIAFEFPLYMLV